MPEVNKSRLFVTLQHRGGRPGFHWALVLAPKSEAKTEDRQSTPCHRFHVTNSAQKDAKLLDNGKFAWRFEEEPFNCLVPGNVVARILLAKLSSSEKHPTRREDSWIGQVELIKHVLECIPLVQDNPNWTCRVWLQQALRALREQGGDFATIPHIGAGGRVEGAVLSFGNEATEIIQGRKGNIRQAGDFPQRDMRLSFRMSSLFLSGKNSPCKRAMHVPRAADLEPGFVVWPGQTVGKAPRYRSSF
jgi:hypothetical protein